MYLTCYLRNRCSVTDTLEIYVTLCQFLEIQTSNTYLLVGKAPIHGTVNITCHGLWHEISIGWEKTVQCIQKSWKMFDLNERISESNVTFISSYMWRYDPHWFLEYIMIYTNDTIQPCIVMLYSCNFVILRLSGNIFHSIRLQCDHPIKWVIDTFEHTCLHCILKILHRTASFFRYSWCACTHNVQNTEKM